MLRFNNLRFEARTKAFSFFALLLTFFFAAPYAHAQVSGTIDSDTTWSSSTVTVSDTVIIAEGAVLTIDPSVTVRFQSNTGLVVKGGLVADGQRPSDRILFTSDASSPAPGDWNGITFVNKSDVGSYLDYTTIEYAGGGSTESNVFYDTGAFGVPFTHSIIRHSGGHGMDLRASDPNLDSLVVRNNDGYGLFSDVFSNFELTNSSVVNNTTGGIRIAVNAGPTISSNRIDSNDTGIFMDSDAKPTITDNKIRHGSIGIHIIEVGSVQPEIQNNRIAANSQYGMLNDTPTGTVVDAEFNYWGHDSGPFHPSTNINGQGNEVSDYVNYDPWINETTLSVTEITSDINRDTTWKDGVFWIKNDIQLNGSYTLTIEPGVIVKFAPGTRLRADGVLHAEGTENSRIVFTSEKDDSYGGDTNQDGMASTPSKGDWNRIDIRNASSVLEYVTVKYGASTNRGALHVRTNGSLSISHLFLTQGARNGIRIDNGSSFQADSIHISEHDHAIRNRENSLSVTVTNSVLEDNNYSGINSYGPIRKVANTTIRDNGGSGIHNTNVSGPQIFENNMIKNNGGHGLVARNSDTTIVIRNNVFEGNNHEGFITSQAKIIDNTMRSNRYPFGIHDKLDFTYTDSQGSDNNVIENNTFNNAIRLTGSFQDTLANNVPADMDTSVYVVHGNDVQVNDGNSLTIDPGVILKFKERGTQFKVDGKLTAVGTSSDPIVFTSWRDTSYGGHTHKPSDDTPPSTRDWNNLRIENRASSDSRLEHIIVRYGDENLYVRPELNHPIDNLTSEFGRHGLVQDRNVTNTLLNSTIRGSSGPGIELRRGEMTVRNSTIADNGNDGMLAWGRNNAAFREVSNSTIKNNNNEGIRVNNATIPQTFKGNIIRGNGGHGIYNYNSQVYLDDVQYIGNVIENNQGDAVVSSAARFIDNEFINNRYPLGLTGQLGSRYEDSDGKDGNIIRNNRYNDIIRIAGAVQGTLDTTAPDSINLRHFIGKNGMAVGSNDSLFVDSNVVLKVTDSDFYADDNSYLRFAPGAVVKFKGRGTRLEVNGHITADGTEQAPIVFTSWRDTTYGSITYDTTNQTPPSSRNWNCVRIRNSADPDSRLENIIVRYGDQNLNIRKSLNHPIDSVLSEYGREGYEHQRNVINTITNSIFRHNDSNGMLLRRGELTVRNTTIEDNGDHGLRSWGRNDAVFREVRNSTIRNNGNNGITILGAVDPISIVNNKIDSNSVHGMHVESFNTQTDSLLIISGNEVSHNGQIGLISTRAMITANTFEDNEFPLGVTHRLSLEGSATEDGNYYDNNSIRGNRYDNAIWLQDEMYGKLGYTYPDSMNNPVYAALNSDISIPSNDTLDIAPGTVIKLRDNRFYLNGTLFAEGSADSKIIFTSWKDDSFGGDSNEDSTNSVPGSNDWQSIRFEDGSENSLLKNAAARYGRHNFRIRNNNSGMVIDSTSSSFARYSGFKIRSGDPVISSAEIHHNSTGVRIQRSAQPQIRLSNIFKNSNYGLHSSSSEQVDATDNYWGHESGPLVTDDRDPNLSGEGNEIRMDDGFVDYRPFLKDRSGILLGDVSTTGTISSFDAALILQYLVDKRSLSDRQKRSANVDGDTTITAMDASYILQYVVDLISAFPGQGKAVPGEKIADDIRFETESGDGWQELKIEYNGETSPFASELALSYQSGMVDTITSKSSMLNKDFTQTENLKDGTYKLAMAHSSPPKDNGTVIHLRIHLKDGVEKDDQSLFSLEKFGFNQYDLTGHFDEVVTSIASEMTETPDKFKLESNYPNPFNPATKITYQVPVKSDVTITLYNALGRQVTTLVDKTQKPGRYTAEWNARNRASGVYLYRISASGPDGRHFEETRKMMLVK